MANQSFPPATALRGLDSFRVGFNIRCNKEQFDPDNAIDTKELSEKLGKALQDAGFKFVTDGGPVSAHITVMLGLAVTATYGGGQPAGFMYVSQLSVLTTVASCPNSDLFVVYDDLNFGSCDPVRLSKALKDSYNNLVEGLVGKLKAVRG